MSTLDRYDRYRRLGGQQEGLACGPHRSNRRYWYIVRGFLNRG